MEIIEKIKKEIGNIQQNRIIDKQTIETIKKYKPIIEKINEETGEIITKKAYLSSEMKNIIEKFTVIEAKTKYEKSNIPSAIKLSKATHHSFSNIPIPTKLIKYTNKIAFFPVEEIIHEEEISAMKEEENSKFKIVKTLRVYINTIKEKVMLIKLLTGKITKEELSKIEYENASEIVNYCRRYNNKKEIIYKEEIIENPEDIIINNNEIRIINEDGEEEIFKITKKREVGKIIFGVGYEREIGKFYAILPVNIFKRKDLTEKKDKLHEQSITYITNNKKIKVDYKSLFLKSIDLKHPTVFTNITATNEKDHEFEILLPVFRLKEKWEDIQQLEIYKALKQIKGISKIKIKEDKTYTIQPKQIPINKPINLQKPSEKLNEKLLEKEIKEVRDAINIYKKMQKIKEIVDKIEIET